MTLFSITTKLDSFDSFRKSVEKIIQVLNNAQDDQLYIYNLITNINDTIKSHGCALKKLSKYNFKFSDFQQLDNTAKIYLDRINEFGDICVSIHDYFKSDLEESLSNLVAPESQPDFKAMAEDLQNYLHSLTPQDQVLKKKREPLDNATDALNAFTASFNRMLGNRYQPFQQVVEKKEEQKALVQTRDQCQAEFERKLQDLSTDFNSRNKATLELLENTLSQNHSTNKKVVSRYFDLLAKKLNVFTGTLFSSAKKMKHEFSAEKDVMQYSQSLRNNNSGSPDFYLHENLMSEDLERTTRALMAKSQEISSAAISFAGELDITFRAFAERNKAAATKGEGSALTTKLAEMIGALADCHTHCSHAIEDSARQQEHFASNLRSWEKRLEQYLHIHGAELAQIDPKDVKSVKAIPVKVEGLDANFFAALEDSGEGFRNDVKDFNARGQVDALFDELEDDLRAAEPRRKPFLQTLERMFTNQIEWLQCSLLRHAESLADICVASKQVALGISVSVGNGAFASAVPALRENTPEYKRLAAQTGGTQIDPPQKKGERGASVSQSAGAVNVFSYLLENFAGGIENGGAKPFKVNLRKRKTTHYTHEMHFCEEELTLYVIDNKLRKKTKSVRLADVKAIRFSEPIAKSHQNTTVRLYSCESESFEFTILGATSEAKRFQKVILGRFKTLVEGKDPKDNLLRFEIIAKKIAEKKHDKNNGIITKLILNVFKHSGLVINKTLLPTKSLAVAKSDLDKKILATYRDAKGRAHKYSLHFKKYAERDTAFGFIRRMCKGGSVVSEAGKPMAFSVYSWEGATLSKGREKAVGQLVAARQDLLLFCVFDLPKNGESFLKNVVGAVSAREGRQYQSAFVVRREDVLIALFSRPGLLVDISNTKIASEEGLHAISFNLRDNRCLFVASQCPSYESLRNKIHNIFHPKLSCGEKMLHYEYSSTFDNILWATHLNTSDQSNHAELCRAFEEKRIFEGYGMALCAENKAEACAENNPIQLFWSGKDIGIRSASAQASCISAQFDATPRAVPVNFEHIGFLLGKSAMPSYLVRITGVSFKLEKECGALAGNAPINIYFVHFAAEETFVSFPSDGYDGDLREYRWEEAERLEPFCVKLYMNKAGYLERTALRIILGTRKEGVLGYSFLDLPEESLGILRKRVENGVYFRGSKVGTIKANVEKLDEV